MIHLEKNRQQPSFGLSTPAMLAFLSLTLAIALIAFTAVHVVLKKKALDYLAAHQVIFNTHPLGPDWLSSRLGAWYGAYFNDVTDFDAFFLTPDDTSLAALERIGGVTELDLSDAPVTEQGLRHLHSLTTLQKLTLSGSKQITATALKNLPKHCQLRQLSIKYSIVSDADLPEISRCQNLEDLEFDNTPLSNVGLTKIGTLPAAKKLSLSGSGIGDDGLAALRNMPNLEQLDLGDTKIGDRGVITLTAMANITHINLANTTVTDKGLQAIGQLPHLFRLDLSGTKVSVAGLHYLTRNHSLKELILSGVSVGDAGAEMLGSLGAVKLLELRNSGVSDKGLPKLAGLRLEFLGLAGNRISDVSVNTLIQIRSLQALYLVDTTISDQGAQRIHDALPAVKITYGSAAQPQLIGKLPVLFKLLPNLKHPVQH